MSKTTNFSPEQTSAHPPLLKRRQTKIILGTIAVAVLLVAGVYLLGGQPTRLVNQALISGVLLGGVYALVSLGLTLIFGVLHIVNFAQGAMLTLSMYTVFMLSTQAGLNPYLAAVLTIPIMFAFGWAFQAGIMNRVMGDTSHERPLLVTLGLSLLIINGLLMAFGGRPAAVESPLAGSISLFGTLVDRPRLIACLGALVVGALLTLVLRKTPLGLAIRAVAANDTGAALVGVNVKRIYAMTFGLGAVCVAVAGGLMAPFTSLIPTAGEQFTTLAFVIVVLGGLGSIPGALVGGLIVGLVQTVGSLYLPGGGSLLLVFVLFLLVLFLRPQGLFGAK